MENSNQDFITVLNSILLLVDYQPGIFKEVESGDKTRIKIAAIASARAAGILNVPVVYTAINPEGNGEFIKELTGVFPEQDVIVRSMPGFDAFEDEKVLSAVKNSRRKKLIVAGLWTSMSFAYTAIHGIREGFDVYGLIDAGGDVTKNAHDYGMQRMLKAGVTPITWVSLTSEWMNDWADPKIIELTKEMYGKYDAMLSY